MGTMDLKTLMQECMNDPVIYAKRFLNVNVHDYNQKYLRDLSDMIVRRAGRKAGKSFITAVKVLYYAFFAPYVLKEVREKNRATILIVAPSKELAGIIFEEVRRLLSETYMAYWKGNTESKTQLDVMFCDRTGVTNIIVRAAGRKGDTVRGYEANVLVMDEASFIPDIVFDAVYFNTIAVSGKTILTSTPMGKIGFFYEMARRTRNGNGNVEPEYVDPNAVAVQYVNTSYENPKVRARKGMLDDILLDKPQSVIRTELYAQFLSVGDGLFDYDRTMAAYGDIEFGRIREPLTLELGVDVAREGVDDTVITTMALGMKSAKAWMVRQKGYPKTTIIETAEQTMNEYNYWKKMGARMGDINIDDTGQSGVRDLLNANRYPTVPEVYTRERKVNLFDNFARLIEHSKVRLGSNMMLIRQMLSMKKTYDDRGVKIETPARKADDYPNSAALSLKKLAIGNKITILEKNGKMIDIEKSVFNVGDRR